MLLRFINSDGHLVEHELGADTVTIGRSSEATLVVPGDKASRVHCGIRPWDQDFILKDYGSTNGTYVNENRVQVAVIRPGDVIRIGSTRIQVDLKGSKGTKTILRELTQEMEQEGKGYRTMLREIVQSTNPAPEGKREAAKPDQETTGESGPKASGQKPPDAPVN